MQEMEDNRPSGVALRGEAPNRPMLRWLKTVVVSDGEKGARDASGGDREGVPERLDGASLMKRRNPGWTTSKAGRAEALLISLADAR